MVVVFSIIIAIAGTFLYVAEKKGNEPVPVYVLGMVSYGWMFVVYMLINSAAHSYKKRYRRK